MGKKSKYPDYSTGTITVNGKTVASTTRDKNNNVVGSSYNMSSAEKKIYNSIQNNFYNSLKGLFDITDADKKTWNSQLNAMKSQGIQQINDIYTPLETNLKNDIANRFGNLDNSVFMDNLNEITDKKSQAISALSNTLLAAQGDLYSNELNNRINNISFLNNLNAAIDNNILNFTNAAMNNSTSGNNYNNSAYNAANSGNLWSNMLQTGNTLVNAAGTAYKFMK